MYNNSSKSYCRPSIGYIITENNIPLDFPMSQETNVFYDGNHHKQKLMLQDKSGSYIRTNEKKQQSKMECNTIIKLHKLNLLISK